MLSYLCIISNKVKLVMSLDTPPNNVENEMAIDRGNRKKLEELMGDEHDSVEMEDYLSYLKPAEAREIIAVFEGKLTKGTYPKDELIQKFKNHLDYLAA